MAGQWRACNVAPSGRSTARLTVAHRIDGPPATTFPAYLRPTGRVLLIYTGGTMGMTKVNGSLQPTRGYLPKRISEMSEMSDPEMPQLDLIEYDPLLDSSNIGPAEWAAMANTIEKHYLDYDGFVKSG